MQGYGGERLFGKNVVISRLNMVINVVISPRKDKVRPGTTKGDSGFEVANCDFKGSSRRPPLCAVCFHRSMITGVSVPKADLGQGHWGE